jgi:hypothetical protein
MKDVLYTQHNATVSRPNPKKNCSEPLHLCGRATMIRTFVHCILYQLLLDYYYHILSRGKCGRGVKLTTHLHLVSRSRMVELYLRSLIRLHGKVLN